MLKLLQQGLIPELWELLAIAARCAQDQGWQLFLVGGAVRDLLIQQASAAQAQLRPQLLQDIDLVVDGGAQPVAAGAGVELARSLQAHYPQVRLEIHGKFQTAALLWQNDPALHTLGLDIATARTEIYPHPAANPQVFPSSIQQDLYRRDFTINAMAIRLTHPQPGELLDRMGGLSDLTAKQIRVLHANSFIDDPTRIFRAVRFAVRLGFQLEPHTEAYFRAAIASGIYQHLRDPAHPSYQPIVPALQTRLKAELKYIFQTACWQATLHQLADLGAFQCIHPTLTANQILWRQLRLAQRFISIAPCALPDRWLVLLEVLLAHLDPDYRQDAATELRLPTESGDRLVHLAAAEADLALKLSVQHRPSQAVAALEVYDLVLLVLVAIRGDRALRRTIWRYLTDWVQVKSPLSGKDLKALGYPPGESFKTILHAVKAARLDGEICDRASALVFLATYYPVSKFR
jgi:tRNA nucleotidyltransferase (CCA-adding enzyme)